jgi:hypothetical protein
MSVKAHLAQSRWDCERKDNNKRNSTKFRNRVETDLKESVREGICHRRFGYVSEIASPQ